MSDEPCQNRSCKSYGKPHPNCECISSNPVAMAAGGEPVPHDDLPESVTPPAQQPQQSNIVPQEDMPDQQMNPVEDQPVPIDDIPDHALTPQMKYSTLPQEIGSGLEGAAQGYLGPLATLAEKKLSDFGVPGLSDEDIKQRAEQNPWIHGLSETAGLGAGLFTGTGTAGWVAKGIGKYLPETLALAKEGQQLSKITQYFGSVGASALKGVLTNASIGAQSEISKAMVGEGDPEHPVAAALTNVGLSGLLGGLFEGGATGAAQTNLKLGSKVASWVAGLGAKASGVAADDAASGLSSLYDEGAFNNGFKSYENLLNKATKGASYSGAIAAIPYIGPKAVWAVPFIEKLIAKPIAKTGGLALPVISKWANEGFTSNLPKLLDYATKVHEGSSLLNDGIESLFRTGLKEGAPPLIDKTVRDGIDEWLDQGGVEGDLQNQMQQTQDQTPQQGYAKGGEVKANQESPSSLYNDHPISEVYPDQHMMLQTAKGRISNYLRGLKPATDNAPRLAFDPKPDQTQQQKKYDRAVTIAEKPLSILDHIKRGTIEPEHVQHLNSMYPEINNVLQKKLTERIAKAQLDGDKPTYAIRQGLSLLMGTPLSSEFTPQYIQAAQAVFKPVDSQQQGGGQDAKPVTKNKKSTSSLTKVNQAYLTGNQALAMKQQRLS